MREESEAKHGDEGNLKFFIHLLGHFYLKVNVWSRRSCFTGFMMTLPASKGSFFCLTLPQINFLGGNPVFWTRGKTLSFNVLQKGLLAVVCNLQLCVHSERRPIPVYDWSAHTSSALVLKAERLSDCEVLLLCAPFPVRLLSVFFVSARPFHVQTETAAKRTWHEFERQVV